jgi:hypothetical protein
MPQAAEQILTDTPVQLISMARPLLADPDWVRKAADDRADEINTCIACNQACLDHAFAHKKASCLVNPRAGHEAKGVQQLSEVNYERIDDDGLHISFGSTRSRRRLLAVDNVVICAGQEPVRDLEGELRARGITPHVIGGAALAVELDAKRAIEQGTELAARL